MIYTVTFNPAIDYVVCMDDWKKGEVNRTKKEQIYYGGKGINVSMVLKQLNMDSVALGFVAGFTGEEIEQGLHRQGVRTDFIHLQEGRSRINVKIKSDGMTELNAGGPLIRKEDLQRLFHQMEKMEKGDLVILAGSIPASLPDDTYESILDLCQKKKIEAVVDASGSLLEKTLKYHPFLIKPNHIELGELFGKELNRKEDVLFYAKKLKEEGARNVLVSMGKDGALLLTEKGEYFYRENLDGEVLNTVGAGDSMVAGFLSGYLSAKDYEDALSWGMAAGNATALSEGLAERELIEDVYRKMNL